MRVTAVVGIALGVCAATGVDAQTVVGERQVLAFDRPEAWAMARASAASSFGGFGAAEGMPRWALRAGFELGHVPHLSAEDRRVGFDGTKLEDLNKSPVFGRMRVWLGLPGDATLELGYTPPLSIGGVRAHRMAAVALERPLWRRGPWRVSGRVAHRRGQVRGDITCDRDTAAHPPGSGGNPFGCLEPSSDRFTDRADSLAVIAALALQEGRIEPYLAYERSRLRLSTQIDARVFAVIDRSRLEARGYTDNVTLGVRAHATDHWEWVAALQWTPLDVRRQGAAHATGEDLWSLRLMLRRRLW